MTNPTRRRAALLMALVVGLVAALLSDKRSTEVATVEAVDTTTTALPATTPATTAVPSTTIATIPETVAPTTVVEPTTTTVLEPSTLAAEVAPVVDAIPPQTPAAAVRTETGKCLADEATCNPPTTPARAEWSYCEQWHELAAEVGWPESQGRVLSYVIHRESSCNPGAYNRQTCGHGNHAIGLMQLCGWGGAELYDARTNLAKGLELWQRSGWCPWVLRGDPVTGHACG